MYRSLLVLLASVLLINPAQGQENRKIPISFLPPPLETATYSLGIYNVKSGQLVRRLQEGVTQNAFTVGLNGLITNWDGKDDAGKAVPPGKYAARGYAVGALKVAGEDILGNDWTSEDEDLRVTDVEAIALVPEDDGLVAIVETADSKHMLLRCSGKDGTLLWKKPLDWGSLKTEDDMGSWFYALSIKDANVVATEEDTGRVVRLSDGADVGTIHDSHEHPSGTNAFVPSLGKDGTYWLPSSEADGGALLQLQPEAMAGGKLLPNDMLGNFALRRLPLKAGEPSPVAVSASTVHDKLYVLEGGNWQTRVRGLSWLETKQEDGKSVSTWQTFFERNIHMVNPRAGLNELGASVEIGLVENPLDPGKPQKVKLKAKVDDTGSYLAVADGLRLRRISQRAHLKTAKVVKGKSANGLILFQYDGAAQDEFSIEGVRNVMAFDAGEIDMTADGEKTHPEKAAEPPDL